MDTKNKAFFWVFGLLIFGAVVVTFLRYFVFLNYSVQTEIDCDPEIESCYVYVCNPKEEDCTGDLGEDTWYYKIITKQAFNYPACDPFEDEDCVIDCEVGEADCEIDLCDPTDPENGQECMTPEKYAELYPAGEADEEELDESATDEDAGLEGDATLGDEAPEAVEDTATTDAETEDLTPAE